MSELVAPYTVASDVPSKAFRKCAVGSSIDETLPPSTTSPEIAMLHGLEDTIRKWDMSAYKINVISLIHPIALERCRDHFVLKETAETHN
jgi:hypothetical protein